jgi:DNA-binding response OmpR family regulator
MTAPTVLVVDPHRELAEMAAEVLRVRGFEAVAASNLSQMCELLECTPAVEVAVCHASSVSGFPGSPPDVVSALSKRPNIGLVVISARPFEEIHDLPANAVPLLKPFGAVELMAAIEKARPASANP